MTLIRDYGIFTAKEYDRFRNGSEELKEQLPSQPSVFYKNKWNGWDEFTGVQHQVDNVDIQEVQRIAIELGIKTKEEWRIAVSTKQIDAPLFVSKVQGFSNWSQFLNIEKYTTFDNLLKFSRSLGIKTQTEWRQWCRDNEKPHTIPFDLPTHYKDDFLSMEDRGTLSFWRYIFVGP
ncbi:hypothetical protein [Shewanella algicola]|uniref:hypothetical protein n=1 Tax=Shewanella algicola TaxID=640633 RepID=UPI0024944692|nr:hypothetical protein [Shewanella algicola]